MATDQLPQIRRRPLSQRYPWLHPVAVSVHRARRRLQWALSDADWATTRAPAPLGFDVVEHASPLLRQLEGAGDMQLQHNKVVNLRLAAARIDGLLIRPGQTFSFNRTVGSRVRRKGYIDGMGLADGRVVADVGGGICQLANLLHWMVLHAPLTVTERSEHSFDPFPDHERVLPWGVGCTIVDNYVDLAVRNDTELTFQLRAWVDDHHLRGELRSDRPTPCTYVVEARDEEFVRGHDGVYRRNEIWRRALARDTGEPVGEELVRRNQARVVYEPDPSLIRD